LLQAELVSWIESINQRRTLSGSIGIHDLHLVQSGEVRTGALDITVIEQDETGKVLRESTNRINLRFTEERYQAVPKSGINFRKSVQPRGDHTAGLDSGTQHRSDRKRDYSIAPTKVK
jgi:hypothetical protein